VVADLSSDLRRVRAVSHAGIRGSIGVYKGKQQATIRAAQNNEGATNEGDIMDNKIVAIILSILLPPVAVFLKKGAGKDLVINILLCILFYIPGIVHALWVTTK